jgi:D-sedoheptulose 7-phosphate isomerase
MLQRVAAPAAPDLRELFAHNLGEHRRVFEAIEPLRDPICAAAATMADCLRRGGRLMFFGNGGSSSDSQHIAAEFAGRLRTERRPLSAISLTADSAALTAIGNDYGYAEVFARQLIAHARAGDVAIGLSTSGRSPNVLHAFAAARPLGVTTIALLGRDGGAARAAADQAIVVPHDDSARIQEAHIFIGHTWCGQVEAALGLV